MLWNRSSKGCDSVLDDCDMQWDTDDATNEDAGETQARGIQRSERVRYFLTFTTRVGPNGHCSSSATVFPWRSTRLGTYHSPGGVRFRASGG